MRTTFETLTLDRRDNGILLVTLNRPEAVNVGSISWSCSSFSVDLSGNQIRFSGHGVPLGGK